MPELSNVECAICLEAINRKDAHYEKGINPDDGKEYEVFICNSCHQEYADDAYRNYLINCQLNAEYS